MKLEDVRNKGNDLEDSLKNMKDGHLHLIKENQMRIENVETEMKEIFSFKV